MSQTEEKLVLLRISKKGLDLTTFDHGKKSAFLAESIELENFQNAHLNLNFLQL